MKSLPERIMEHAKAEGLYIGYGLRPRTAVSEAMVSFGAHATAGPQCHGDTPRRGPQARRAGSTDQRNWATFR